MTTKHTATNTAAAAIATRRGKVAPAKPTKNPAAVALGRMGGLQTSPAKRAAAARNARVRWERVRSVCTGANDSDSTNSAKLSETLTGAGNGASGTVPSGSHKVATPAAK